MLCFSSTARCAMKVLYKGVDGVGWSGQCEDKGDGDGGECRTRMWMKLENAPDKVASR